MPFVELDEFRVSGRRNQTKYVVESEMYQQLISSGGVPPPAPDVMQPISKKEWLAQLRGWENSIKDMATKKTTSPQSQSQSQSPPQGRFQSSNSPQQALYQPPSGSSGAGHRSPPATNYQPQHVQQPAFQSTHQNSAFFQSSTQASMQQIATLSHQLPPPVPVPVQIASQPQSSNDILAQDSMLLEGSVTSSSGSVPKFMLKRPRQFNVAPASPSANSPQSVRSDEKPRDELQLSGGVPMSPLTPASSSSSTPGPSEEEVINGKWTTSPKGPSTPQHWRHFHPARKGSFAHNGASTVPVTPAVPNQTPVCDHSLTSAFTSCDGGYPADEIFEPMSPGTTSRILKLLKDRRILSEGTKKVAFDMADDAIDE